MGGRAHACVEARMDEGVGGRVEGWASAWVCACAGACAGQGARAYRMWALALGGKGGKGTRSCAGSFRKRGLRMSKRGLPMPSVESTRTAHFAFQVMLAYLQICKCQHASFHTLYTALMLPTLIDIKACWRIKSSRLAHQVCVESVAREHGVMSTSRASRP